MKYFLPAFLLFCIWNTSAGQTKKIAWKSHSGSEELFALAYENHLFDMDDDNEGLRNDYVEYKEPMLSPTDTMIRTSSGIFPAYKAVICNDSLFNQKPHMTDSVRKLFKKQIPASQETPKKKGYIVPFPPDNSAPPASGALWIYVILVALFAAFTGLFSWQYRQSLQV